MALNSTGWFVDEDGHLWIGNTTVTDQGFITDVKTASKGSVYNVTK
jgi:hypothetical protein